jgi:mannose-6-phosphate isomerase-like protein (cupin superfamily)
VLGAHGSEFHFFLSGTAVVYVDGDEVSGRRGTVIYLPPGCVHSIRNVGEDAVDLVYGLSGPEYGEIGLVYDE